MDSADCHIKVLELLINSKSEFLNLNIGTGIGTSVLELSKIFEEVNKCQIPTIFSQRRKGDIPFSVADNSLALEILD